MEVQGRVQPFTTRPVAPEAKAGPEIWILTYGSGDIEAVVASDEVSVGNYTAHMKLGAGVSPSVR